MKAIVHIGTIKTATSSIQEFLYKNQNKLILQGYYFIQSGGIKSNRTIPSICLKENSDDNYFKIIGANTLEKRNIYRKNFIKRFSDEINSISDDIHTVIISSEHFHYSTNSIEEVENVKIFLSNYFDEIEIICYLREQLELCTSHYSSEIVMAGLTMSFDDFINECSPKNIRYNYFDMLLNWEKCFGMDNIKVAIFDSENLLNNNIIDDFISKVDSKLIHVLEGRNMIINQSINHSGQTIAKAVNKAFPKFEADKVASTNAIRVKCQKIISDQLTGLGEQISPSVANEIYFSFSKSNEKLRRKYFPDLPSLFKKTLFIKATFEQSENILSSVLAELFLMISKNSNN